MLEYSRSAYFWNMSDGKEVENTPSRGNEWEVVSLTSSAYDAAPGGEEHQSGNGGNNPAFSEDKTARELFMSGHFVFPPAEHENLPIDHDADKDQEGQFEGESNDPSKTYDRLIIEDEVSTKPEEEDWSLEGHSETADVHEMQYPDEAYKSFEVGKDMRGFDLTTDTAAQLGSSPSRVEDYDDSEEESQKGVEDRKSDPPCKPRRKKHKVTPYSHSAGTKVILSVVVAAAIVGLYILGKRLRRVAASAS